MTNLITNSLTVTVSNDEGAESLVTIPVSAWDSSPTYDPNTKDTYVFNPTFDLPEGYTLTASTTPPAISVIIKDFMPIRPASASGWMTIGGETVSDLDEDAGNLAEKGWEWDSTNDIITLASNYDSNSRISSAVNWATTSTLF